jgi:hypothetical protein
MEPVVAIYDACVLYSAFLRDFLIRLAIHGRREGLLRAKWTGRIHREWVRAVRRRRPDIERARLLETCRRMDEHVRGCRVSGYERWERRLILPDANDRHVLAAAIVSAADVIVTRDRKGFPDTVLSRFMVDAVHPDQFVLSLGGLSFKLGVAEEHRRSYTRPALSAEEYLASMRRNGLVQTAEVLKECW